MEYEVEERESVYTKRTAAVAVSRGRLDYLKPNQKDVGGKEL